MDKNSRPKFYTLLESYEKKGLLSAHLAKILASFFESYKETSEDPHEVTERFFITFLERVKEQAVAPYQFQAFHKKLRTPFDYYRLGIDFLRPLIKWEESSVLGQENLEKVKHLLKENHNVVFFSNHQTEADPMAISLLLEKDFPDLAEKMIFVAGERVTTDPLAIPFSLGCNLLCIYSKRYIDHPPEHKHQKQMHNRRTMRLMSSLLSEGGKCIYVAPSGGRDRRGVNGKIELAPFDPKSIEMFHFMAKRSKQPTHFFPMALGTFELLPPPETIQRELGEHRSTKRVGIHLAVGPEIQMQDFPGKEISNKEVRRKSRSDYIWELVKHDYSQFPEV